MKIDKDILTKISHLALLELSDEEKEKFQKDLSKVISYFEKIKTLNTNGIEPLNNPLEDYLETREDKIEEFSDKEKMLDQAPSLERNLFKVPPVMD